MRRYSEKVDENDDDDDEKYENAQDKVQDKLRLFKIDWFSNVFSAPQKILFLLRIYSSATLNLTNETWYTCRAG